MKKLISLLLVLAMLFGLSACSLEDIPTYDNFIKTINKEEIVEEVVEDQNIVKIGVIEPITGQYSQDCIDELNGIQLANQLFPTVLQHRIELVIADNESSPEIAQEKIRELIAAGCKVIIGSCNNILTLAISDYTEDAQIPLIMPSCTNPLLTTTNNLAFRICIVEDFQGNSAAKYMTEKLAYDLQIEEINENSELDYDQKVAAKEAINAQVGTTTQIKCAVLKDASDDRASALIEFFQNKMEGLFGDEGFTRVIEYPEGTENMQPYFEKIKETGAEAVFFPCTAQVGEEIIYQAYELGYDFKWVGVADWTNLIDAATKAQRLNTRHLEGVAFVQGYDAKAEIDTTMSQNFKSSAKLYYDVDEPSQSMTQAFDAYLVAFEGLRTAGIDASTSVIASHINNIRELECATGSITYRSGNGDPVKDVVIEKIVNGKSVVDYIAVPNFGI